MPPASTPHHAAMSRRTLLGGLTLGAVSGACPLRAAPATGIRAIAFDAFPIFDTRSLAAAVREAFPEQGERLMAIWSQKLFDYAWLDTAADQFQDFDILAGKALRFAAAMVGVPLSEARCQVLVAAYSTLDIWPDVRPVLDRLHAGGIRMAFLSNMTDAMLRSNISHTGLERYFEPPLSTGRVRRYKPSPAAYQMAIEAFGLPREAIGFAAFGGWDAVGATWFGYRSAWINRLGLPAEPLGPEPAIVSRGLEGVLALAGLA